MFDQPFRVSQISVDQSLRRWRESRKVLSDHQNLNSTDFHLQSPERMVLGLNVLPPWLIRVVVDHIRNRSQTTHPLSRPRVPFSIPFISHISKSLWIGSVSPGFFRILTGR
jgi:hypothetical protein